MAAARHCNGFPAKLPLYVYVQDFLFENDDDIMEDDDSSEDLDIFGCCSVFSRRNLSRICDYFEVTIPMYQPDVFRSHFRLSRSTFELLCRVIVPTGKFPRGNPFGREVIDPSKQIVVAIWIMANQESYRQVSDRFDMTYSSVYRCFSRFTEALEDILPDVIQWPNARRAFEISDGFERFKGFPRVVGAVDGSHIPIKTPSECQDAYLNRLKYHSIVLQGICDHEMLFTHIYVGWPGSVHDARVLRNSEVSENWFQGDTHLLGDSAYPLYRWLMTPFKNNGYLTPAQTAYNTKHSGTRQVIERAFGLLKGRWRKLKKVDMDVSSIPHVVAAACVLHNFCLLSDEGDIEEFLDNDADGDVDNDDNQNGNPLPQATAKRMLMVNYLQ